MLKSKTSRVQQRAKDLHNVIAIMHYCIICSLLLWESVAKLSTGGSRMLGQASSERQEQNVRVSFDRATFEPFQPHKGGRWHPELTLYSVLMKKTR